MNTVESERESDAREENDIVDTTSSSASLSSRKKPGTLKSVNNEMYPDESLPGLENLSGEQLFFLNFAQVQNYLSYIYIYIYIYFKVRIMVMIIEIIYNILCCIKLKGLVRIDSSWSNAFKIKNRRSCSGKVQVMEWVYSIYPKHGELIIMLLMSILSNIQPSLFSESLGHYQTQKNFQRLLVVQKEVPWILKINVLYGELNIYY